MSSPAAVSMVSRATRRPRLTALRSSTHAFTPNLVMELKTGYTRIAYLLEEHQLWRERLIRDRASERQHDGGAEYDGTGANLLPHGRVRESGRLGLHAHHRHQQYVHLRRLVDLYARRAQHQSRRADYPQTTQLRPEPRAPGLDRFAGLTGNSAEDMLVGFPLGYIRGNLLIHPEYRG